MKIVYEIRYGRKAMMYTLWRVSLPTDKNERYFENYVQNLSIDYQTTIEKAKERAKLNGFEVVINAPENLREILRGDNVIRWGKYKDMKVSDIRDDKYLIWLFKGAFYKNDSGNWNNKLGNNDPIRLAAEEILLEKGLVVEYNDRIVTKEKAEELKQLEERNSNSDYIGNVGAKVELNVKIEKVSYFDGVYGTTWVTTMRDENDNVVIYKGKCLDKVVLYKDILTDVMFKSNDSKFWKNLIHIGVENGRYHTIFDSYSMNQEQKAKLNNFDFEGKSANYIDKETWNFYNLERLNDSNLQVGDQITITGTVKEHLEYKETKQTILQRVKVL